MTRPRAPRPPRGPDISDPAHPDYMHPAELDRLQKEFLDRVDHLAAAFLRKSEGPGPSPSQASPFIADS